MKELDISYQGKTLDKMFVEFDKFFTDAVYVTKDKTYLHVQDTLEGGSFYAGDWNFNVGDGELGDFWEFDCLRELESEVRYLGKLAELQEEYRKHEDSGRDDLIHDAGKRWKDLGSLDDFFKKETNYGNS